MSFKELQKYPMIADEMSNMPYRDLYSEEFSFVLAALRVHGFYLGYASEATAIVEPADDDLYGEAGRPCICIRSRDAGKLDSQLREAEPGSPKHTRLTNQIMKANLLEQKQLLLLLEEFYTRHNPPSFYARLIAETSSYDLGETIIRPQGGNVRAILNKATQKKWAKEGHAEFMALATFLAEKAKGGKRAHG